MLDKATIKRLATQVFDYEYKDDTAMFERVVQFASALEAAVREEMAKQEPVAWRYWKDKFGCWEYDEAKLEFPAVPAGTKMHPLYAAPVVPDDMVVAPREPSDRMIHAAKRNGAEGSDEEIASDYRAMIAEAEKQK